MNQERPPQFNKAPSNVSETKTFSETDKLSSEQINGIKFAAEIGRKIQIAIPQIATDYVNGLSLLELVYKYDIQKNFGMANIKSAKIAVLNALGGYSGDFSASYSGLIDSETLKIIGKEHRKDSSSKLGELTREEGRGIFGMTKEEKREVAIRAGMDSYQTRKGIHTGENFERKPVSFEVKQAIGKKSVVDRGFIPFSEEEETFMKSLDLNTEQYRTRGVKINAKKITRELNEKFHNARKSGAVGLFLRKIKKRNAPQS